MSDFVHSETYQRLHQFAYTESSVALYTMLETYRQQPDRWDTPEDFLVDTIFAMATVLKGTQEHFVDVLAKTPPTITVCANCGQPPFNWK